MFDNAGKVRHAPVRSKSSPVTVLDNGEAVSFLYAAQPPQFALSDQ